MSSVKEGYCPTCGYDMTSLPVTGSCPECGEAYEAHLLHKKPPPSALRICCLYGWPVLLLLVVYCVTLYESQNNTYAVIGGMCMAAPILVVAAINSLLLSYRLGSKYGPSGDDDRLMTEKLKAAGGNLAVTLFWITLVVPATIVGGCALLVVIGM